MKIAVGKTYRTRNGLKVGPLEASTIKGYLSGLADGQWRMFQPSGRHGDDEPDSAVANIAGLDLVAEWAVGPVVIETVKRIVPGIYGTVDVGSHASPTRIYINVNGAHDASMLRAVVATLSDIADALDGAS